MPSCFGKCLQNLTTAHRRVRVTLDHMRDSTKYRKWIKGTCKSEGVEIEEVPGGGGLVFILRGEEGAVEEVLLKWRTEKVDVNIHVHTNVFL